MNIEVPITVYVVLLSHRQPPGSAPDTLHEFIGVATSGAEAYEQLKGYVRNEVGPLTQRSETYATVAISDDLAGFIYKVVL